MIGLLPSFSGNSVHPSPDARASRRRCGASSKYSSVASLRLATAFAPLVLELPPLRPVALLYRPTLADGADLRALRDVHILFPVEHGRERPHDLTDRIASPFVVIILTDVFEWSSRLLGRVQTRVQIWIPGDVPGRRAGEGLRYPHPPGVYCTPIPRPAPAQSPPAPRRPQR